MQLRVTTPTEVIIDREVTSVQAEDRSGRFGIRPHHEPYLTALMPAIIVYRFMQANAEVERYIAAREGVLRVTGNRVLIAVRDAVAGDDLSILRQEVRALRSRRSERTYRAMRSLYQMQISAWRQLVEYGEERTRE